MGIKKGVAKKMRTNIRSMTGFGKGSAKSPYGRITVEIKTLNHKHLSIGCLPCEGLFLLEERMKEMLSKKVVRGKASVKISISEEGRKKPLKQVRFNEGLARTYLEEMKNLQKKISVKGEIGIKDIISFPGVIEQTGGEKEEKLWPYIKKAVEGSIEELMRYRAGEGGKLLKEFLGRLKKIEDKIKHIKKFEKESIKEYRGRLAAKIEEATGKNKLNKINLEEEVALFARNCDIAEEICRLGHHVETYRETLNAASADVGKKLDFIAQEMHREANTIGSKAADYRISSAVIDVKSEIEKIREQVKNIE